GVLGGALGSRFGQADAGHLVQQVGPLLEAVRDGAGQGVDALQAGGQVVFAQADLLVEGEQALTAAPAVVVGAGVADGPDEAGGGVGAVAVEAGGVAALRAGHRAALVAVFFYAGKLA